MARRETMAEVMYRKARKSRLGSGERFRALAALLAQRGARNPEGLAAWIGRRALGKKRFQKLAASGRRAAGKS